MIPEIGLVLALYVIARLTANARPLIARTTAGLAIALALLVGADLSMRGFTSEGLIAKLQSKPEIQRADKPAVSKTPSAKASGTVTRADGGSISTTLSPGIVLSGDSSLKREWIAIHEPAMPVDLVGTPGIATAYARSGYSGEYRYRAKFSITTTKAIRAIDVKFLVFNVWGEHVRILSSEDVEDLAAGTTKEFSAEWDIGSADVSEHYASIAYVARVRLEDGHIIEAPIGTVLEEAQKFSAKFTADQLTPKS